MDIPLHILKEITNDFSKDHKIGSGGYGDVYKGIYNGEDIAVKLLHQTPGFDQNPFGDERVNLMSIKHRHIVRLIGYCYEIKHRHVEYNGKLRFSQYIYRILCFEYLQRGSLDKYLKESHGDDWCTLYIIIKGVCEGLKFLHEGCKPPILHLDLKPSNILLEDNMVPKIADNMVPKICDFGLSRLFPESNTHVTEKVIGTLKYMPPEYERKQLISPKHDIFSLGVIIIEIVAGPAGYDEFRQLGDAAKFIELVNTNWRKRINATEESDQVETCIRTAIKCVDHDRNNRPTVAEIVDTLEETEKRFADKSRFLMGQMIKSSPGPKEQMEVQPRQLRFPFLPNEKLIVLIKFKLVNNTDDWIGFTPRYLTENAASYFTRPSYGVLPPRSTQELVIERQARKAVPQTIECEDKIILYSTAVSEDFKNKDIDILLDETHADRIWHMMELCVVLHVAPQIKSCGGTKINLTSMKEMIQVHPSEIRLPFTTEQEVSSTIKLVNITDDHLVFTTRDSDRNVASYKAEPSPRGILRPRSTHELVVTRKPYEGVIQSMQCHDKFFIYSTLVSQDFNMSNLRHDFYDTQVGRIWHEQALSFVLVAPTLEVAQRTEEKKEDEERKNHVPCFCLKWRR